MYGIDLGKRNYFSTSTENSNLIHCISLLQIFFLLEANNWDERGSKFGYNLKVSEEHRGNARQSRGGRHLDLMRGMKRPALLWPWQKLLEYQRFMCCFETSWLSKPSYIEGASVGNQGHGFHHMFLFIFILTMKRLAWGFVYPTASISIARQRTNYFHFS